MAIGRTVLERVGGFDEELGCGALGSGEETLVSYQAEAMGMRILRMSDAAVEHHFDPGRLEPRAFLAGAAAAARSAAYIAYHWKHEEIPSLRRRYLSAVLRLRLRRMLSPGRWRNGVPPWEVSYVRSASFYRQYMNYRGTPRKYEKCGLRKLRNPTEVGDATVQVPGAVVARLPDRPLL
jgi:hypothetical protein